jgi:hypothetical protein
MKIDSPQRPVVKILLVHGTTFGIGFSRDYRRLPDPPAPDPKPKNEEHLAEGRDESEIKVGIRKNVRPQAGDHPT